MLFSDSNITLENRWMMSTSIQWCLKQIFYAIEDQYLLVKISLLNCFDFLNKYSERDNNTYTMLCVWEIMRHTIKSRLGPAILLLALSVYYITQCHLYLIIAFYIVSDKKIYAIIVYIVEYLWHSIWLYIISFFYKAQTTTISHKPDVNVQHVIDNIYSFQWL